MNNTGVFNPSGSLIFLFLLLLPTAFHILKAIMSLANEQQPAATFEPEEYTPTVNIGKIIYNKNKVGLETTNYRSSSKPKKKKKKSPESNLGLRERIKTPKKLSNEAMTPKKLSNDAVDALSSLGFGKRKAKNMVDKLCINKCYDDVSSIIKDCFSEDNS